MDLALNNLQRLICHKTQQTKPNHQDDIATHFGKKVTKIKMKEILVKTL